MELQVEVLIKQILHYKYVNKIYWNFQEIFKEGEYSEDNFESIFLCTGCLNLLLLIIIFSRKPFPFSGLHSKLFLSVIPQYL